MINIKITNTNVYNLAESIVASGFPMLTKDPTDDWNYQVECVKEYLNTRNENYSEKSAIGKKHFDRALKLGASKIGSGHSCYLKGVLVTCNITADKVFWSQWQRYHYNDIISSMSFMHRLSKLDINEGEFDTVIIKRFKEMIEYYNTYEFESPTKKAEYFEWLISNAPSGIELTAHIYTNYLQLLSQYIQRKTHKRESWSIKFINWCDGLSNFKELTGE